MAVVVVGSMAFDTVETPLGREDNCLGGSATHFGLAARLFTQVQLVSVVGEDFPDVFASSRAVGTDPSAPPRAIAGKLACLVTAHPPPVPSG